MTWCRSPVPKLMFQNLKGDEDNTCSNVAKIWTVVGLTFRFGNNPHEQNDTLHWVGMIHFLDTDTNIIQSADSTIKHSLSSSVSSLQEVQNQQSLHRRFDDEIVSFLQNHSIGHCLVHLLPWGRSNSKQFPLMSVVVWRLTYVQMSSVWSERNFLQEGILVKISIFEHEYIFSCMSSRSWIMLFKTWNPTIPNQNWPVKSTSIN